VDHKNLGQAKHILKYIFPHEFRLHNVFTNATDRRETTHAFKDYTDREQEILNANHDRDAKVYRRLAGALALISKMQKLQKGCSYDALIKYYCNSRNPEIASEIVEEGSMENDSDPSKVCSQKEISVLSTFQPSTEIPLASKNINILQHYTPHHQVRHSNFRVNCRLLLLFAQLLRILFRKHSLAATITCCKSSKALPPLSRFGDSRISLYTPF
jgi:hypothetical protein